MEYLKQKTMSDSELDNLFEQIENTHFPNGPVYQSIKRRKALLCLKENELQAIYHLTESHSPNLRIKAALQYEKSFSREYDSLTLNKNNITFVCTSLREKGRIDLMLKQVSEMPKEWSLVQLTPRFNIMETLETNSDKKYCNPIHITIFNCGQKEEKPICVTVDPPVDKITGEMMDLCKEMSSIVHDNGALLSSLKTTTFFTKFRDKEAYKLGRQRIDGRLKDVTKQMRESWFCEWCCLFIGKLVDEELESRILVKVEQMCTEKCDFNVSGKTKTLLRFLIKGFSYLTNVELKRAVRFCFEDKSKNFQADILRAVKDVSENLCLYEKKRHPVILIVDEKLDLFPWEMMEIIQNHPISRMPSFSFTYALFKEHEGTIVNGLKIGLNPKNGAYILNPNVDLPMMELRLKKFFEYWLEEWKGLVGVKPTPEQFEDLLTKCDIFSYNGHGSGAQFLSGDQIQKLRVNAVVMLFGCSSIQVSQLGPQVEMSSQHYTYLIACSPCVMGMLWTVTDLDTDLVTTELLSQWIPSNACIDWKNINKKKWGVGEDIEPLKNFKDVQNLDNRETEFLRILCKAKKSANYFITRAACVARGLPVQLNIK